METKMRLWAKVLTVASAIWFFASLAVDVDSIKNVLMFAIPFIASCIWLLFISVACYYKK